jgi:hypothetical protein
MRRGVAGDRQQRGGGGVWMGTTTLEGNGVVSIGARQWDERIGSLGKWRMRKINGGRRPSIRTS